MSSAQHELFREASHLPEGFQYGEEFLSPDEEQALIETVQHLPFREFEFRGFLGKRRTVSFGWRYDFNVRELQRTEAFPTFLLPLRKKAAEFAGLSENGLQHALVTEYPRWGDDRLAQRPARIRRCDRYFTWGPLPVSLSSQKGHSLGARIIGAPTPLSVPSPRSSHAGIGSTASRPLTRSAIRSPSGV